MRIENVSCASCNGYSGSLYYIDDKWVCKHCRNGDTSQTPYFKESGGNPFDPKASKVHIADVRNRRLDTKTNKMFYHEPPKTYFFPKGK